MSARIRQSLIVVLALASAAVGALSTFLTWFHVRWSVGQPPVLTNLTAYQSLGTHRNPVAPSLIMIGAAFALLAGVVTMDLPRLRRFRSWAPLFLLAAVVLEAVGALTMKGPLFKGAFTGSASRGPGATVCLVGAALCALALLVVLAPRRPQAAPAESS